MNDITFVDRVRNSFDFLISKFGFNVIHARNSEVRPQTDGTVKYQSNNIMIVIGGETGYASLSFSRVVDSEKYYLSLTDVHEYLYTTDKEKELLLSINPSDKSAAESLFNVKYLLNQPGWKRGQGSVQDLEKELQNFAHWLKEHADLCLTRGFPNWLQLYEYRVQRSRAEHLRLGKDEIGPAGIRDTDGKWKIVQQSRFKDKLDYIEKLKKEASK